jgi:hypothetical protein
MQPIWRGWNRLTYLLRSKRLSRLTLQSRMSDGRSAEWVTAIPAEKRISAMQRDLYWESGVGFGRERLLNEAVRQAKALCWAGDYDNAWADWDIKLVGDCWHDITIRTATEELGGSKRFTRARCTLQHAQLAIVAGSAALVFSTAAAISMTPWAVVLAGAVGASILLSLWCSRRRCLRTAIQLMTQAGHISELEGVGATARFSNQAKQIAAASSAGSRDKRRNTVLGLSRRG